MKKVYHSKSKYHIWIEVSVRVVLAIVYLILEHLEPFRRKIHPDELWLYKNPRTASYIPTYILWVMIVTVPLFVVTVCNLICKPKDGCHFLLGLTLTYGINGIVTDAMKLTVGRPRPDFFYRCFPDGRGVLGKSCTGLKADIIEGLKSFPSGHSSFAFASMTFCTLYLCGKLKVFHKHGKGQSWRLILSFCPVFIALLIALSRTCDYHHHWQDVLTGSLIGICISSLCYYQIYPTLNDTNCNVPLCLIPVSTDSSNGASEKRNSDSLEEVTVKWI